MHRLRQLSVLALAVVAGAIGAATPAFAASNPTPFDVNLVRNPGFEDGVGTTGYSSVSIPHWDTLGTNATVVKYGSPEFPTRAEADRIGGGRKFLACGPDETDGIAGQLVRVQGRRNAIDGGHVRVTLKARLAGYADQNDIGRVWIRFTSPESVDLGTLYLSDVSGTDNRFVSRSASRIVPVGTTHMYVYAQGLRYDGAYCDAYFDNIRLILKHV
ncbi:MAG: hypothetical protein ABIP77_05770 [Candidatus Limnocylindrales bacterium]